VSELVAAGPHFVELYVNGEIVVLSSLSAETAYHFDDIDAVTLADIGPVLSIVVTMNDVHFGEVECGKIEGVTPPAFTVQPGEVPYPEIMNGSVVSDAAKLDPDLVVVKGDLTSFGTVAEYERFLEVYHGVFGDRLLWVRGNHDSYPGQVYADWSVQCRDVPGLRIILLDTSRVGTGEGFVSQQQCEEVDRLCRDTSETVIVMGHHPLFVPGVDRERHFTGVNQRDSAALFDVLLRHRNVVSYSAGHTHRCRRETVQGLAVVEVACVKDFPGAYGHVIVGEHAIAHVVRRASHADAIEWAEKTRTMFDGFYGTYAWGTFDDRCFVLPKRRD
jgi:3',5'-cyclic AMP phosphodiesterase CpdA